MPKRLIGERPQRLIRLLLEPRAAVKPATSWSLAMPFRDVSTETMQAFLDAAARKLRHREHAIMVLYGVGWHCAHNLRWPRPVAPEARV